MGPDLVDLDDSLGGWGYPSARGDTMLCHESSERVLLLGHRYSPHLGQLCSMLDQHSDALRVNLEKTEPLAVPLDASPSGAAWTQMLSSSNLTILASTAGRDRLDRYDFRSDVRGPLSGPCAKRLPIRTVTLEKDYRSGSYDFDYLRHLVWETLGLASDHCFRASDSATGLVKPILVIGDLYIREVDIVLDAVSCREG
jgi:hypothetical protein